jgi:hypothetical protein
MPPKGDKNATAEPDPNRVRTRAQNANTHPGTAAKDALRVRNPPRDPDVIHKEKVEKASKKEEKQKMVEETQTKKESTARYVDEYRARQETDSLNEIATIPRQKPKGQLLNLLK